jgi:hypothetical protein
MMSALCNADRDPSRSRISSASSISGSGMPVLTTQSRYRRRLDRPMAPRYRQVEQAVHLRA